MSAATWQELPAFAPMECALAARIETLPGVCRNADAVVSTHAMQQMESHAAAAGGVEVIGLLLGGAFCDARSGRLLAVVDEAVAIQGADASRIFVQAGAGSWQRAWGSIRRDAQVVGWYHSHPGHGIFFSATDQRTQRDYFGEPWNVGLVIDPSDGSFGIFAGATCRPATLCVAEAAAMIALLNQPA